MNCHLYKKSPIVCSILLVVGDVLYFPSHLSSRYYKIVPRLITHIYIILCHGSFFVSFHCKTRYFWNWWPSCRVLQLILIQGRWVRANMVFLPVEQLQGNEANMGCFTSGITARQRS